MLDINDVSILVGNNTLNYNRQLNAGEITTLQGISGVGKTSLLLCIAGFIAVKSGQLKWNAKLLNDLPSEKRPVAMLFQENNLFEHISVLKNASLGQANTSEEQIMQAAEHLVIADHMHKIPSELSGGQRQRVALLRTLLRPEPVVLLDEPFAELDYHTREICAAWVADRVKATNKTLLLVTHQNEDVERLADHDWQLSQEQY
jgi:thiamine transport system ATP-binding protein